MSKPHVTLSVNYNIFFKTTEFHAVFIIYELYKMKYGASHFCFYQCQIMQINSASGPNMQILTLLVQVPEVNVNMVPQSVFGIFFKIQDFQIILSFSEGSRLAPPLPLN